MRKLLGRIAAVGVTCSLLCCNFEKSEKPYYTRDKISHDFYKIINAEERNYLHLKQHPIAFVIAIEILVDSHTIKIEKLLQLTLRSLIRETEFTSYNPKLLVGDEMFESINKEILLRDGSFVEVSTVYRVPNRFIIGNDVLRVSDGKNENRIIGVQEKADLLDILISRRTSHSESLLYWPIQIGNYSP